MTLEDVVETRQPTELGHSRLVQTARDLRLDLESEMDMDVGILASSGSGSYTELGPAPPSLPSSAIVKTSEAANPKAGSVKARAKPKARGGAGDKPALVASKMRKDTTKAWTHMQTALVEAQKAGQGMLEECVTEHGSEEQARAAEQSFVVVEQRMKCLRLLSDEARAKPSEESGLKILAELQKDSYFMEQGWPWTAAQTLGQMSYVRHTAIELQRTSEAVHELAADHRDAMELVKTVAASVIAEASSWRNNVAALRKSRDAEQRELIRQQKRAEKVASAKAKAQAAKEKKAAEKKSKQEAAAADETEAAAADDGAAKKRRGPTAGRALANRAQQEVGEDDPVLLQSLAASATWPKNNCMALFESTSDLANHIASTAGMIPAVARLRRSSIKKILDVRSLES